MTIRQIAKIAGVHHSTVDKVIHNRQGVSEEVRIKIKKILEEVGYKPNLAGKALASHIDSFRMFAILLEVDAMPYIKEGIQQGITQFGPFKIDLEYATSPYGDIARQAEHLRNAIEKKVSGIILMPIYSEEIKGLIQEATLAGIRVVTVDSDISDSNRMNFIGQDLAKASQIAGRMMGTFLNGTGKIAILTGSQMETGISYNVEMREKLFVEYLQQKYPQIEIIKKIETKEKGDIAYQETKKLLSQNEKIQGIYITCGHVAQVGEAIKESDFHPVVICFEGYPEILKLVQEEIVTCTIDSELEVQGAEAVKQIMNSLLNEKIEDPKEIYTKSAIIIKESL